MNYRLTAEAAAQLQEGINLLLAGIDAIRLAVENEWGGRHSLQKAERLGPRLFRQLTQSREEVYIEDLLDIFDEILRSLNTQIADGNIEEIAESMIDMHVECLEGNFDSIKRLKEANTLNVIQTGKNGHLREDNSSDMDIDASQIQQSPNQQETLTDEPSIKESSQQVDGWTLVSSKRNKRGKRNGKSN